MLRYIGVVNVTKINTSMLFLSVSYGVYKPTFQQGSLSGQSGSFLTCVLGNVTTRFVIKENSFRYLFIPLPPSLPASPNKCLKSVNSGV